MLLKTYRSTARIVHWAPRPTHLNPAPLHPRPAAPPPHYTGLTYKQINDEHVCGIDLLSGFAT